MRGRSVYVYTELAYSMCVYRACRLCAWQAGDVVTLLAAIYSVYLLYSQLYSVYLLY